MTKEEKNFNFVESEIKKKTFGMLSTIDKSGYSHSTGIVYGVAPTNSKFALYVLTEKKYKKVKNIENNNSVSFVIPFPHHLLRFVPSSCVQFQGIAKVLPFNDKIAQESFINGSRILRLNLKQVSNINEEGIVFIQIIPNNIIHCYGLGISLIELRKNISSGSYSVKVPLDRQ